MEIREEELEEIIEKASAEGARAAIKAIQKKKMYKEGMDTYQKTEYVLKNYNEFRRAVEERENTIADISMHGLPQKSRSFTTYPSGSRTNQDSMDKADEEIENLQAKNMTTMRLLKTVDHVLDSIKDEPYFDVISKYYFENKKYEVIAGELAVSTATISTAKKNLVNKIKIRMFADEVIREILGQEA